MARTAASRGATDASSSKTDEHPFERAASVDENASLPGISCLCALYLPGKLSASVNIVRVCVCVCVCVCVYVFEEGYIRIRICSRKFYRKCQLTVII